MQHPEFWTPRMTQYLEAAGFDEGRITVFKSVNDYFESKIDCTFGCPRIEWQVGRIIEEPHATNDKDDTCGLYALPLGKRMLEWSLSYRNVLLMEAGVEYILGVNSQGIRCSKLEVFDSIKATDDFFEEIEGRYREKRVEVGRFARSWKDVFRIMGG